MKKWHLKKLHLSTARESTSTESIVPVASPVSPVDYLPRYKANWKLFNLTRAASGKGAGACMTREAIVRSCEEIERRNPGVYSEAIAFIHRILDERDWPVVSEYVVSECPELPEADRTQG